MDDVVRPAIEKPDALVDPHASGPDVGIGTKLQTDRCPLSITTPIEGNRLLNDNGHAATMIEDPKQLGIDVVLSCTRINRQISAIFTRLAEQPLLIKK